MQGELLKGLSDICGSDHILHSPEAIQLYSRCTIPWSRTCGAVALPENAHQISRIIRLCNDFKTPVWTFSRGHNWGYGTVLALQEGAVILILKRMNRIHEVNEELCYAVIEPGVSQKQLSDHLKNVGSRLWVDCTDSTPDGSIIGNALDKGIGYSPYGDHFGHLCGMEVVLANGEIISTGGAPNRCPTRYTYRWGLGPFVDGLFVQSSLGLVTKAGLWLMPKPEAFEMFVASISNPRNLAPAIDAYRELGLRRVVNHCHGFNGFLALARSFSYPTDLLNSKQFLSEKQIDKLSGEHGFARWTFVGGIYGTSRQVRAQKREITKHLSRLSRLVYIGDISERLLNLMFSGARESGLKQALCRLIVSASSLFGPRVSIETVESLLSLYRILKGEPNENILAAAYLKSRERQPIENLDPARDGCRLIWFAPILPAMGEEIQTFIDCVKQICSANRLETAVLLIQQNPRTFLVLVPIFYRRVDKEETERAENTYGQLCELLKSNNYQQYRCSTPQMATILDGNPAYQLLMKRIKQALDPNQVIAPGRYGV